ncbi:hypothetical protein D3C87_1959960 [compost metagenome]
MFIIGNDKKKPDICYRAWKGANKTKLIQPFGVEHTFFISAFVCVRTEVVTLRLNQVSWQHG